MYAARCLALTLPLAASPAAVTRRHASLSLRFSPPSTLRLGSARTRSLTAATRSAMATQDKAGLRHRPPPTASTRSPSPSPSQSPDRALHSHSHSHAHGHGHAHGHSHGIEETQQLASAVASLRNPAALDPGSRITLVGLVANVGLTVIKGAAGYLLASSALLADAAHSGSDLVADVVTLASYRVGRWKPSPQYPYGYGSESRRISTAAGRSTLIALPPQNSSRSARSSSRSSSWPPPQESVSSESVQPVSP